MNRLITLVTTAAVVAAPVALGSTAAHAGPDAAADGARRPAAYSVTAKASPQDVTLGEGVVTVRGKVRPRAAGKKLVLERRVTGASTWSVAGRTKIKPDGTYLFTDEPTVARTHRYRVVKRRSGGVQKGMSPVVEVRVYGWERLAQRPRGVFENIAVSSTAVIGGVAYPYSFQPFTRGAPSYVEFPLRGLCTDLRATYAMHDSSAVGSSSRITLAVDGVTAVDQVLIPGQVVASTADLTGAATLRYDLFSSAEPASYPVVVAPEVLCTR
ncbi:hypothetical protein [Nocardioides sp. Soil805]|uniref:hypothetical protein n=1 Tax=Nocardioides sp. Soil805 TaxID=1736416 RepID=UPI00070389E5|nr:hypothetical protein [Nocardioides sp. Soil805]KRF36675.1 hypothetical protein ASG94_04405 [Nocardioides sp. Soil805]